MAIRKPLKHTNTDASLIWLVHPGADEPKRAAALSALGYRVGSGPWNSPEIARKKAESPCAVVVDLSRSPSMGRDTAVAMRSHRSLVDVPFLLVGGTRESVAIIRALLPDVVESTWSRIAGALDKVQANPPSGGRQTVCIRRLRWKAAGGKAWCEARRNRRSDKCSARIPHDARSAS